MKQYAILMMLIIAVAHGSALCLSRKPLPPMAPAPEPTMTLKALNVARIQDRNNCLACDVECKNCDLEGADFSGIDLHNAVFDGANLRGANFTNANLIGASMRNADLTDANFTDADLRAADMTGAADDNALYCRTTFVDGSTSGDCGAVHAK